VKVERLSIQRVHVSLSCGCNVTCDFRDTQCKEPFEPVKAAETGITAKNYSICKKHDKDSGRSMLEFMMGERMDEAIEDARRQPEPPKHLHPVPQPASLDGVTGESVSRVATVAGAKNRPRRPPAIKQLRRTAPQVIPMDPSVGEETDEMMREGDIELGRVGDTNSLDALISDGRPTVPQGPTPSLDEVLDSTDPTEDRRAASQGTED
jgi:hypothetical protein